MNTRRSKGRKGTLSQRPLRLALRILRNPKEEINTRFAMNTRRSKGRNGTQSQRPLRLALRILSDTFIFPIEVERDA